MSGVTTGERATWSRSTMSRPSTASANTPSAVSILVPAPGAMCPRVPAARVAVGKVSRSVASTGRRMSMPVSSRHTGSGRSAPPVRTTPASGGKSAEVCAASIAGSRALARSEAMITTWSGSSRSRMLGSDMAATSSPETSRPSRFSSPKSSRAWQACCRSRSVGARSRGTSGST